MPDTPAFELNVEGFNGLDPTDAQTVEQWLRQHGHALRHVGTILSADGHTCTITHTPSIGDDGETRWQAAYIGAPPPQLAVQAPTEETTP